MRYSHDPWLAMYFAHVGICEWSGLPCILPMLVSVNGLMKFVKGRDVFVCDYIVAFKTLPRRFVQNV